MSDKDTARPAEQLPEQPSEPAGPTEEAARAIGFDIGSRRISYDVPRLEEDTLGDDPIALFREWLQAVADAGVAEPNACVLSTADEDGLSRGRTVLARGYEDGFRFFTNYSSTKGRHLAANPQASMCFPWLSVHRQVIVSGPVEKLPAADSDEYFAARPPESQVASALSPQSQVLDDLGAMLRELEHTLEEHPDGLPRPEHWGGYRLDPQVIEFWQGNVGRLHDRFRFRRDGDRWVRERLAP